MEIHPTRQHWHIGMKSCGSNEQGQLNFKLLSIAEYAEFVNINDGYNGIQTFKCLTFFE